MRLSSGEGVAMLKLITLIFIVFSANAMGAAPSDRHLDPLRGETAFTETTRPPPLLGAENRDLKRVRSYAMQPPTIPHSIDNYQIDRFANRCMMCHSRSRAGETQATPISITHYTDRSGNFLADVAARRYFCDTCHVVQMDAEARVKNTFEDVESLVRRTQAQAQAKGKNAAMKKK
jgi:nitrate reductase (cytochrome), electron transfer subunit